jgi:hypothetical protein
MGGASKATQTLSVLIISPDAASKERADTMKRAPNLKSS